MKAHAITDKKIIDAISDHLREGSVRNYLMFRIGLNLGVTVQELLSLTIEDVLDKDFFVNEEGYKVCISPSLQEDIENCVGARREGLLFISRNGLPISRCHLYTILNRAASEVGMKDQISALSLRKTFAYWAYKENEQILPTLSCYLKHQTLEQTLSYIGVDDGLHENELEISAVDL